MLDVRIELRGDEIYCTDRSGAGDTAVRRLTAQTLALPDGWVRRYDAVMC